MRTANDGRHCKSNFALGPIPPHHVNRARAAVDGSLLHLLTAALGPLLQSSASSPEGSYRGIS